MGSASGAKGTSCTPSAEVNRIRASTAGAAPVTGAAAGAAPVPQQLSDDARTTSVNLCPKGEQAAIATVLIIKGFSPSGPTALANLADANDALLAAERDAACAVAAEAAAALGIATA